MFDEERIVELLQKPPEISSHSIPTSRQHKTKTPESVPSKPTPRDEDLFQRVHIIREIRTVKKGPQTENSALQQRVSKAVAKMDVIGLKALLKESRQYGSEPYLVVAGRENLQLEAFRILIQAGEDVSKGDTAGRTSLHFAPDAQIAGLLISYGADVDAVDEDGRTPLHLAKDEHIARVLISRGAHAHAVDSHGQTPPLKLWESIWEDIHEKLRKMGTCISGYEWIEQDGGYRCAGGGHFVAHGDWEYS
jgi:hypothetical protein